MVMFYLIFFKWIAFLLLSLDVFDFILQKKEKMKKSKIDFSVAFFMVISLLIRFYGLFIIFIWKM